MKLSPEQERERLARWLRNDEHYDDWAYGTEPIPGDHTWAKERPLMGPMVKWKLTDDKAPRFSLLLSV